MSTTTATCTESEAKAFVDQAAQRLMSEFNASYVYLCLSASHHAYPFVNRSVDWATDVEFDGRADKGQIRGDSIDELIVKLRGLNGADAKLARIAELRKQADELEASIQADPSLDLLVGPLYAANEPETRIQREVAR